MTEDRLNERTLQLVVTEDCNLRCRYCYEHTKTKRQMPSDIAISNVEKYLTMEDDFEGVIIDFTGGEPLLCFDLIKEVVDFVHSRKWPKRHHFFLGTNATLLTDEMKEWLKSHKGCLSVGTSLDGTKKAHDYNRSNSYDDVVKHIPFLKENWPKQSVKMTIGPDVIDEIAQGVIEIVEMGLPIEANVVFEDVWGEEEEKIKLLKNFRDQLDILVEYFSTKPHIKPPRLVNLGIEYLNSKNKSQNPRWCGYGKYMVTIDVDGNEYDCHRFTPFGSNNAAQKIEKGEVIQIEDKCSQCLFVECCPSCAGYNWEMTGNPELRTTFHCDFLKLQFLATAKLKFHWYKKDIQELSKGNFDLKTDKDKLLKLKGVIDGIIMVQENIDSPV